MCVRASESCLQECHITSNCLRETKWQLDACAFFVSACVARTYTCMRQAAQRGRARGRGGRARGPRARPRAAGESPSATRAGAEAEPAEGCGWSVVVVCDWRHATENCLCLELCLFDVYAAHTMCTHTILPIEFAHRVGLSAPLSGISHRVSSPLRPRVVSSPPRLPRVGELGRGDLVEVGGEVLPAHLVRARLRAMARPGLGSGFVARSLGRT